jgi:hypothetical protein
MLHIPKTDRDYERWLRSPINEITKEDYGPVGVAKDAFFVRPVAKLAEQPTERVSVAVNISYDVTTTQTAPGGATLARCR